MDELKDQLKIKEQQTLAEDFWQDQAKASVILKEKSAIENKLNSFLSIQGQFDDEVELFAMAQEEEDVTLIKQILANFEDLNHKIQKLEIECLFNKPVDVSDCFLEINAGAGGTDSCDFALMLLRMYQRFCENLGLKVSIVNYLEDSEAGIRSATIQVSGVNAFGWLKTESGVHRLVRISPFNAAGKRQTSFASIWVYPKVDDDLEIEILDKDLRVDTFRASGAGGQHVNKTDSAVRITHIPTNIAVSCQSDRSQLRNRQEAMRMLKSRLYELEMRKKQQEEDEINASKTDNSWGNQIRSYVMHPYQMVKDLRSGFEVGNYQKVLDGDLEGFIKSNLIKNN